MSEELKPDECIEKLKQYEFKDDIGHPLEKCVEYIQLCAYTKKEWNTMCRLRWTTEPPKKPGWYWHFQPLHFGMVIEFFDPDENTSTTGQWAGPIPEPEE